MKIGEFEGKPLIGLRIDEGDIIFSVDKGGAELSRFQTYTFSVGEYPYKWDEDAIAEFKKTAPWSNGKRMSLLS